MYAIYFDDMTQRTNSYMSLLVDYANILYMTGSEKDCQALQQDLDRTEVIASIQN